jgi:hypothetical protein
LPPKPIIKKVKVPVKKVVKKKVKKEIKAKRKSEIDVDPMDKPTPAENARALFLSGEGEVLKEKEEKERIEKESEIHD